MIYYYNNTKLSYTGYKVKLGSGNGSDVIFDGRFNRNNMGVFDYVTLWSL